VREEGRGKGGKGGEQTKDGSGGSELAGGERVQGLGERTSGVVGKKRVGESKEVRGSGASGIGDR